MYVMRIVMDMKLCLSLVVMWCPSLVCFNVCISGYYLLLIYHYIKKHIILSKRCWVMVKLHRYYYNSSLIDLSALRSLFFLWKYFQIIIIFKPFQGMGSEFCHIKLILRTAQALQSLGNCVYSWSFFDGINKSVELKDKIFISSHK